ncbi:hypothetical protein N7474_010318 [Penicillium riverlandense]|uniref:uncharacterized protein n=1 Tax=Penicillium riverlandense TaxID=1903569 RepID=UPI0025466250|nr:uncharacterized protein N7474_010318 [Penicillium riverlandense]KAJ5806726.1 hypothetical protein N7474_010318 [Penicillium riverlandense]
MLVLDIALYAILGTSLVFSIIELGLGASAISAWTASNQVSYYYGYGYENINISAPPIVSFLVFTAVWTMLASGALLFLPWFYTRKGCSAKLNMTLSIVFTAVYFLTMVFWLASFADIASYLGGGTSTSDAVNAAIAFAVLLWLLFTALFILIILTLCGVLASEWPGYQSLRKSQAADVPAGAGPPAQDVPMSRAPVVASDPSTQEAEALHNQPQLHEASSPSAGQSAELSGESTRIA